MPDLLPSLLDRLDHPRGASADAGRGVSEAQFVESLLRDLNWLLNHTHLEALEPALRDFPEARVSVLNYGIRPLAGRVTGETWEGKLGGYVRQAIERFEPRLRDVVVKVTTSTEGSARSLQPTRHSVEILIEARLRVRAHDVPLRLLGRLDPDVGRVALRPGG